MKTTYHFFASKTKHHVPRMVRNFNSFHEQTGTEGRFVLMDYHPRLDGEYAKLDPSIRERTTLLSGGCALTLFFLRHLFNPCSVFVLHGFNKKFMLLTALLQWRRMDLLWANWGTGLNPHQGLRAWIHDPIRSWVYRSYDRINVLMRPDYEEMQRFVRNDCQVFLNPYHSFGTEAMIAGDTVKPMFDDQAINILVGNHGGPANQHKKWFEVLKRFRDEPIRVIVFAGYGTDDESYLDEIEEMGRKIFGEKFVFLGELLDRDSYIGVMRSVDVLIIDGLTQRGLAAITQAAYFGGTIYLTPEGRNQKWMTELGIRTFHTESIVSIERSDGLCQINSEEKARNMEIIAKRRQSVLPIRGWTVFIYGLPCDLKVP